MTPVNLIASPPSTSPLSTITLGVQHMNSGEYKKKSATDLVIFWGWRDRNNPNVSKLVEVSKGKKLNTKQE